MLVGFASLAGCLMWERMRPDAAAPRRTAAVVLVLLLLVPLDPARPWPAADLLIGSLVMLCAALLLVPNDEDGLGAWMAGHRAGLGRAGLLLLAALATAWIAQERGPWGQAIESDGAYGSLGALPFLVAVTTLLAIRTLMVRPRRSRLRTGPQQREATDAGSSEVLHG